MIRYLKHSAINKKKWDDCIEKSNISRSFGFSWYLDIVSPNWHALVLDDYQAVMPLTWKRRYGLFYLIQPVFCQQLGIFTLQPETFIHSFLKHIPRKFLCVKISISNNEPLTDSNFTFKTRTNYILYLKKSSQELKREYSKSNAKNIRKAINREVMVTSCPKEESISFLQNEYHQLLGIRKKHFDVLNTILARGAKYGELECFGAYSGKELLASSCCLLVNKHIFMTMVASGKGKKARALFLLIDNMIENFSNRDVFLDFGGSDVESIAYFFKGFGAQRESYYEILYSPLLAKFLSFGS